MVNPPSLSDRKKRVKKRVKKKGQAGHSDILIKCSRIWSISKKSSCELRLLDVKRAACRLTGTPIADLTKF